MKRIPSWLVLVGALLFVGVLSAVIPSLLGGIGGSSGGGSAPPQIPSIDLSVDQVQLPKALAGLIGIETMPDILIFAILTAIVFGAVIGAGVGLWIIYRMLDNTIVDVKEDDEYKSGVAELENRRKAANKQYLQDSPPTPIPSHERPGWTAISTTMLTALMLSYFGAAFSDNFLGGSNQLWWSVGFAAAGAIAGLAFFRKTWVIANEKAEGEPVDWGMIWVVLTGVVVVGIGLGVMMWVRVQGGL